MTKIAVAKKIRLAAFPRSDAPQDGLVVYELEEALNKSFDSDAHLTTYYVDGVKSHPRIQKASFTAYEGQIYVSTFMADVDNPQHASWSEGEIEQHKKSIIESGALDGLDIYYTSRG